MSKPTTSIAIPVTIFVSIALSFGGWVVSANSSLAEDIKTVEANVSKNTAAISGHEADISAINKSLERIERKLDSAPWLKTHE